MALTFGDSVVAPVDQRLEVAVGLSQGVRVGPYQIVSPLGAGGMGTVYKATDTRLGRTVAIKVLADRAACDPQQRLRFELEARAVSTHSKHEIETRPGAMLGTLPYMPPEQLDGKAVDGKADIFALGCVL